MRRTVLCLTLLAACRTPDKGAAPTPPPPVAVTPETAAPGARTLFDEAISLRRNGDDAGALAKLDAALSQAPTFALAALERAEIQVLAGNASAAQADATLAANALPQNPRAQRVLGQVREDSGDLGGAVQAYEASLVAKDDPSLRRRVASLAARAGRTDDAVKMWEAIRTAEPDDLGAHMELAALYERQERLASAEGEYDRVVALAPENAALHRRFADFLDRQGKAAKARKLRSKADALAPPATQAQDRHLRALQPSSR